MSLTPKQQKFCQAVVRGMNQSDAYRQAYDAKRMSSKTVNQKACRLMAKGNIGARVAELRAPVLKKVQYDQARWLEEVQRCAFVDPRQLFDADGNPIAIPALTDESAPAVAGFEVTQEFSGKGDSRELVGYTKKIKITDKLRALELFGKATGYYVDKSVPPLSELETTATSILIAMLADHQRRRAAREVTHAHDA